MARFAVSAETARRDFLALTHTGLLERAGRGRRTHYGPTAKALDG